MFYLVVQRAPQLSFSAKSELWLTLIKKSWLEVVFLCFRSTDGKERVRKTAHSVIQQAVWSSSFLDLINELNFLPSAEMLWKQASKQTVLTWDMRSFEHGFVNTQLSSCWSLGLNLLIGLGLWLGSVSLTNYNAIIYWLQCLYNDANISCRAKISSLTFLLLKLTEWRLPRYL